MLQTIIPSKQPHAYRPGVLLNHIANDFNQADKDIRLLENELLIQQQDGPTFKVVETIRKNFLQHISCAKFILHVTSRVRHQDTHVRLFHDGWIKRKGLRGNVLSGGEQADSLVNALTSCDQFVNTVLPLDFTHFELFARGKALVAELTLYGGSEVVSQFPAFRRYVRLDSEQQQSLINGFRILQQVV